MALLYFASKFSKIAPVLKNTLYSNQQHTCKYYFVLFGIIDLLWLETLELCGRKSEIMR